MKLSVWLFHISDVWCTDINVSYNRDQQMSQMCAYLAVQRTHTTQLTCYPVLIHTTLQIIEVRVVLTILQRSGQMVQ